MKKIFLMSLVAFVACSFAACSNDDDAPAITPEVQMLEEGAYNLDEIADKGFVLTTIKFSSNTNWNLSSDKMWVLFSTNENGEYFHDINGVAGTHTVFVKITDVANSFEPSSACVNIACGDSEFLLSTIERPSKERDSQILDEDGNPITSIQVDGSASGIIKIDANYEYGIKYYPEWIEEPVLYNGGYILTVKEEYRPYPLTDKFIVSSADGNTEKEFELTYSGMEPSSMIVEGEYPKWKWEISLDGKAYRNANENSSTDGEILLDDYIPFVVKCLNYDYKLLVANEEKDGSITIAETPWLLAETDAVDKSKIVVKATEFASTSSARSRKGCLFAIPAGMYDSFIEDLNNAADATSFIDNYEDYVIVEATQKDLYAAEGFSVTTYEGESVACEKLTSGDIYDWISHELGSGEEGLTEIYAITGEADVLYVVNTLYTDDEWLGGGFQLYDSEGEVSLLTWDPIKEKGSDGYYRIYFTTPVKGVKRPTVLRLHINNVNMKALVIMPTNN